MTGFAWQLRALREARSWTQEELAERAGLTAKAVGALERGERRRPYPHTVRALADALGLDAAERSALVASVPGRSASAAPGPGDEPGPAPAGGAPLADPGPLVGRATDVERVLEALRDRTRRVVTLTGPGGVGKTTLSLAVARRSAAEHPGGVVVVDLAAATTRRQVLSAIGRALGVPEAAQGETALELVPSVAGRRVLLVLDNLEQVLDCAADLATLVQHCPDLVVLATSRAPLRIRAEREVPVAPLAEDDAAALFLDRATAAGATVADGAQVRELCRRVEGLPLGLELAASAAALLDLGTLVDRLDTALAGGPRDLPERQRSMAATLAWSVRLLEEPERRLLRRLALLPGTFSLDAVDRVCGGPALAPLRTLVDHSLVARAGDVCGTARFRVLEPVRQHLLPDLTADERDEVLTAVTAHVAAVVPDLADEVRGGSGTAEALDLLEADVGLVRLAAARLEETGHTDEAAELAWRLWLFLTHRGHAREGLAWLSRLEPRPVSDTARVQRQLARAGLDYLVGDIAGQRASAEAAWTLAVRLDRLDLAAEAGVLGGSAALFQGELEAARPLLTDAVTWARELGAPWIEAHALIALAQVELVGGAPGAEEAADRAVAASRALGNPFTVSTALNVHATLTALHGDDARTLELLTESVRLSTQAQLSWTLAYALPALAGVAVRLGDAAAGVRLFAASASYAAQHAVAANFQASRDLAERDLDRARAELSAAAFAQAWDAGRDATVTEVLALAEALSPDGPGRRSGGSAPAPTP